MKRSTIAFLASGVRSRANRAKSARSSSSRTRWVSSRRVTWGSRRRARGHVPAGRSSAAVLVHVDLFLAHGLRHRLLLGDAVLLQAHALLGHGTLVDEDLFLVEHDL